MTIEQLQEENEKLKRLLLISTETAWNVSLTEAVIIMQ